MYGRRRPHRVTERSEMPPTIGCHTIATTVPIDLRTLDAVPSFSRPTSWMIMSGRISAVRLFHRYPIAIQYSDRTTKLTVRSRGGEAAARGAREIKAKPRISWGFGQSGR